MTAEQTSIDGHVTIIVGRTVTDPTYAGPGVFRYRAVRAECWCGWHSRPVPAHLAGSAERDAARHEAAGGPAGPPPRLEGAVVYGRPKPPMRWT